MEQSDLQQVVKQAITANVLLDDHYVSEQEVIYTSLHGTNIERFRLKANQQSYILKRLPVHQEQYRELWVYKHIMPLLPDQYPQLIAYATHDWNDDLSGDANTDQDDKRYTSSWIVMEDVGEIQHVHHEQTLINVIDQIANYHQISTSSIYNMPTEGQKPSITVLQQQLLSQWDDIHQLMQDRVQQGKTHTDWLPLMSQLKQAIQQSEWNQSTVLCHGDLHAGNYGVTPTGRLMILDWEHCHLNIPLWDLYHMIDLSHPLFPRAMNTHLRIRLLSRYWEQQVNPLQSKSYMIKQYSVFAIIFSSWMLLLIERDLQMKQPIWTHAQLYVQQDEVWEHLEQCIQLWQSYK